MTEFNYEDFTIENFKKLVPENFIGTYIEYLNGEKDIFFTHKKYRFISDVSHECIGVIREDITNGIKIYMHRVVRENKRDPRHKPVEKLIYYVERDLLDIDFLIERDIARRLFDLGKKKFNNCIFEKVIGIKFERKYSANLYHTYIPGIDFLGLTAKTPEPLKDELENVVAKGMREIHDKGIEFSDPMPGNLKYNFDKKLILSPHNCMILDEVRNSYPPGTFESDKVNRERDLAIIIYTHDWITNPKRFIKKYVGEDMNKLEETVDMIDYYQEELEYGDVSTMSPNWQKRGRFKKLKK